MAITLNGSSGITSAGNITAANNITASGNITASYLIGNGRQLTGVTASANTGNIGFTGDAVYNLSGIIVENADLSHGATAALILPSNGNATAPVQLNNTYGNIVLTTGTDPGHLKNWTLDTTGNITLPTNTSSINYANGQPYGGSGGGANIGNLDITGTTISIATGASQTYINLSSSVEGWAYVQVPNDATANVYDTRIHNDAGNIEFGTGNYSTGSTNYTWKLGNNGNLTFPDNSGSGWPVNQQRFGMGNIGAWLDGEWTIGEFSGNGVSGATGIRIDPAIEGYTGITLPGSATSNTQPVQIYSTNGGGINLYTSNGSWTFNADGGTLFPTLTVNLHNGGSQTGQTLQFGDPTQQAIITGPTPTAGSNAQRMIIQGQNGGDGEGGDVYLWAGDSNVNGGDIKIYAGDADVSGYGGYINIDAGSGVNGGGQLTLTSGQSSGGQGGQITITPGYSGDADGALLSLNGGQGAGAGGGVNITAGYGGANGGQVNITGGQSALGLAHYGNVVVSAGASAWTFDNTGTVTFPGNTQMGTIEGSGTFGFYNANANTEFLIELGPTNVWSFNGASGITGLPDNTLQTGANVVIQTPSGTPATLSNWVGQGGWNQGYYSDLATTGGTGTGLTVDVAAGGGGYISINQISIHTPGTGYTNGDVITITNEYDLPGTFTIGVAPNNWTHDTTGNLTVAGSIIMPSGSTLTGTYASPAPSINGFGTISSANVITGDISVSSGRINGGTATVVTDGINSIAQAPGAQMDVFGFPFSGGGVRGQLTISDVTTPTEANGTWYYQSLNTYTYQLYTDSTYSTLVDASGWASYTGSGAVAITKQSPASNVVINTNGYFSTFDNTGNLTLPRGLNSAGNLTITANTSVALNAFSPAGNIVSVQAQGNSSSAVISIFSNAGPVTSNWTFTTAPLDPTESFLYVPNGGAISTPEATGGEGGKNIFIQAGASDSVTWNSNPGGELFIKGGYGSFGDGGGGAGGNVNIEGGPSSDSHAGNVNINSGGNTWVFDYTGKLTIPGPTQLAVYANATVRDSSISSPTPGMMIYVTGTGMQVRGATSWNTIAGSGT